MDEIEREKEDFNNELLDSKAKLLKFADKEKQWQNEMALVVDNEKALKEKHDKVERRLQKREKDLEYRSMSPIARLGELCLVQYMS